MYSEQGLNIRFMLETMCKKDPLTEEKEKELAILIQKGDVGARNELVEHNLRLIFLVMKKFNMRKAEFKDYFMAGALGLIRAADLYAPEIGRFSTYAHKAIERKILQYIMKNRDLVRAPMNGPNITKTIFIEDLTSENSDKNIGVDNSCFFSTQHNNQNIFEESDTIMNNTLTKALSIVDEKTADMLKMFFGVGYDRQYNLNEIAKKHNYNSRQAARQTILRTIKKIRKNRQKVFKTNKKFFGGKSNSKDLRFVGSAYCMKLYDMAK